MAHDHKYAIADGEAVQVLIDKMLGGGTRQRRREKLLRAFGVSTLSEYQSQGEASILPRTVDWLRGGPKALIVSRLIF